MRYVKKHSFGDVQGFEVGIAPAGRPIKSVYIYKVGSVIIDTGPYHLRQEIKGLLEGSDVSKILLTHHHEDHSGNAALLQRSFDVPVYLHEYGVAKLSRGFKILPYQQILFGKVPPVQAEMCPDSIEGEDVCFTAIHTPGHSKDHTVYFEETKGWLFSGDLWVGEKIQFFRSDEHINQQIESLQKIMNLEFEMLFCGHRPSTSNCKKHIARKLEYLISFQQQVLELHQQGFEESEIVKRMRTKNDLLVKTFTMGNASFSHIVRSSLKALSST